MQGEDSMAVKAMTMNNLNIAVLELHGEFTSNKEINALKSKATDLFEQGNRKLIIDLGSVNYINSLGIGSLVSIYTMYAKDDGKIKICQMGNSIQNVFVITRLITIFDVEETKEEAIKNFNKQ
jgi:anti-sigma B factor antagonist